MHGHRIYPQLGIYIIKVSLCLTLALILVHTRPACIIDKKTLYKTCRQKWVYRVTEPLDIANFCLGHLASYNLKILHANLKLSEMIRLFFYLKKNIHTHTRSKRNWISINLEQWVKRKRNVMTTPSFASSEGRERPVGGILKGPLTPTYLNHKWFRNMFIISSVSLNKYDETSSFMYEWLATNEHLTC